MGISATPSPASDRNTTRVAAAVAAHGRAQIDRHRQHQPTGVVGVIADEIDPTGRKDVHRPGKGNVRARCCSGRLPSSTRGAPKCRRSSATRCAMPTPTRIRPISRGCRSRSSGRINFAPVHAAISRSARPSSTAAAADRRVGRPPTATRRRTTTRPSIDTALTLAGSAIEAFGNAEQKQALLPPMARGEIEACIAYTEAHAGSDLAALSTTRRSRRRWIRPQRPQGVDHRRPQGGLVRHDRPHRPRRATAPVDDDVRVAHDHPGSAPHAAV